MTEGLGSAEPKAVGLSSDGLAAIDRALAEVIAAKELAGAVTLVARRGKIVHRSVQGLKHIADGAPLTNDTIFAIFSMTKPITAAAMMVLHDRGRWSPDDPITRHLPEFAGVKGPNGDAPVHPPTMGELMTHTAGFGYGVGPGPHDDTDKAYIAAGVWQAEGLADMSRRIAAIPLAYEPGAAWRYSLSMDLQGAVIERLTGQSLPDFMRETIFQPLGMVDTDFYVPAPKQPRLAVLYHMYGTTELTVLDLPGYRRDGGAIPALPSGGGGLYATADDYARFAQMLLNKGELGGVRVLTPSSVETMTANHLPQAIMDRGVVAGMQKIAPGAGYGYNGAVFTDPAKAGVSVGVGTYQWDGAAGTWFWIDPENELLYVGMIQRMLQEGMPRLQVLTQDLIAKAMICSTARASEAPALTRGR